LESDYNKRLDNQRTHEALGEEILTDLIALENEYNKLPSIEDARDLALAEERIKKLQIELLDIIQILQKGGHFRKNIPANLNRTDEFEYSLIYERSEEEGYVVEVLELLPRILDLETISQKLIDSVDEKLNASTPDERLAAISRTASILKEANTFLLRSRESANRIHYESHLEMQEISAQQEQILKYAEIIRLFITLIAIIVGGYLSYRMFQQIKDLLQARNAAEVSLREAELHYRTVADFTYDWEYWRAPNGNLLYVSPSCERITGYSADYMLKHPDTLEKIVIPEDKMIWEKHGDEIEKEYTLQEIEFRIRRKGGEIAWIEHSCQPVITSTGEFIGFRASNRDISERVMTRTSLTKSEERYRLLAENMIDFVWVTDLKTMTLSYASPSVKELLGNSPEEILHRKVEKRLSPDSYRSLMNILAEELHLLSEGGDKERTRALEIEMVHKEGHLVPCETTARFLYDEEGNPNAILGSARDVTDKIHAENALRESESLYRSLVENASIGILLATADGKILSVNNTAIQILGSPSKEATLKINLLTFPPLIKNGFAADFQDCLKTRKTIQNENAYVTKWSKEINSRYTLTPIQDAKGVLIGGQILLEDITEEIKSKEGLREQIRNLATINAINTTIITRTDLDLMITNVVEEIAKNLSVDATDLLVYDEHALTLTCTAQYGFRSPAGHKKTVLRVGEGYAGDAALKRKTVRIDDLKDSTKVDKVPKRWKDEDFLSYYGIPLLVKGELKGILEIFHRSDEKRTQNWISTLEALAQQAAIAIDNHFLLDALRGSNMELELAYETTLEGWARALELRDYETKGHTDRVAKLALELARELNVKGEDLTHIRRGALLHDIGKIAISDTILLKEGNCTPEEWEIIQQHPQYGYDMLKEVKYLKPSLDIVLYHHEKWDGSGYPAGLAGENIPFSARIFAIIDVWDALLSNRPYHKAWGREKALAYIQKESGKHFEPRMVTAFNKIIRGENE
jgi:PAS domain S-box-containing protein/putative nucleotidyltransferase with HDIG domain